MTQVERWNISCRDCGHAATTFVLAGDGYGRLLGRTQLDELVEFNTWDDSTFDEIKGFFKQLIGHKHMDNNCFRKVLSLICDQAPSGKPYDFNGKILCSNCGSSNVAYGPFNPPEFTEKDVSYVTHLNWDHMSKQDKELHVRKLMENLGCLSG